MIRDEIDNIEALESNVSSNSTQNINDFQESNEKRISSAKSIKSSKESAKLPIRRKKSVITINTTACKYDIVRLCSKNFGLKIVDDTEPWSIYWIDTGVSVQRILEMEPYQKINHFPGMHEICRKDHLARNISRISRLLPKDYNFFPKTWILPSDWADLKRTIKAKKRRTYISKPDHGCQGKGIFLFRSLKTISQVKDENIIVQQYLMKPCLLDSFKFDLRVYVLVTSADPLRIFVHRDGLARFATEKYSEPSESNLSDVCMHLTNYAINKKSSNFNHSTQEDAGSKRTIQAVFKQLEMKRGIKPDDLWSRIEDVIVKTLAVVQPQLSMVLKACFPANRASHKKNSPSDDQTDSSQLNDISYGSQCFEILGFDIFLDNKLKPWVLEVNHSPSFTCDSPLDEDVKKKVIGDTLKLLNLSLANRKKFEKGEKELIRSRLLGSQKLSHETSDKASKTSLNEKVNEKDSMERIPTKITSEEEDETTTTATKKSNVNNDIEDEEDEKSEGDDECHGDENDEDDEHIDEQKEKDTVDDSAISPEWKEKIDGYYAAYPAGMLENLKAYEDENIGSFKRIFPSDNPAKFIKYLRCIEGAQQLFSDTAATKRRQEYLLKKKEDDSIRQRRQEDLKAKVKEAAIRDMSVKSKFMNWQEKQARAKADEIRESIERNRRLEEEANNQHHNESNSFDSDLFRILNAGKKGPSNRSAFYDQTTSTKLMITSTPYTPPPDYQEDSVNSIWTGSSTRSLPNVFMGSYRPSERKLVGEPWARSAQMSHQAIHRQHKKALSQGNSLMNGVLYGKQLSTSSLVSVKSNELDRFHPLNPTSRQVSYIARNGGSGMSNRNSEAFRREGYDRHHPGESSYTYLTDKTLLPTSQLQIVDIAVDEKKTSTVSKKSMALRSNSAYIGRPSLGIAAKGVKTRSESFQR